jgi:hypothetical protein
MQGQSRAIAVYVLTLPLSSNLMQQLYIMQHDQSVSTAASIRHRSIGLHSDLSTDQGASKIDACVVDVD